MAKIRASLADVSTEYVLPDPGPYVFRVKEITENVSKEKAPKSGMDVERVTYVVKSVIVRDLDGNEDHVNKPVFDYINIHTKEGELNDISLANLKRYFEAIIPERADAEDADTDELVNGEFQAQLYHDSYEDKNTKEERHSAKIKSSSIQPVS